MKKTLHGILLVFLLISYGVFAQDKVLVYYETNGFEHQSIDEGIAMVTALGDANGLWETDASENSTIFTPQNLAQYKVVVWCNTSGDGLLEPEEQAAFENYIANGGGYVGIHAATDTYRDGSWPFYNELVGAIVRTNPNHTRNNYEATMSVSNANHPTVAFLNGATWTKKEEYYYWNGNGGKIYDTNQVVLTVAQTGNQPYDESRPISWYKEFGGGRSFYTALGHNEGDYINDNTFRNHVEEGIKWAGSFSETVPEIQLLANGNYVIKDPKLGEVIASREQLGNNAAMESETTASSQQWVFKHLGNNVYTIKNLETNRYLEVPNAKCANGANVATWTAANSNHQKFKIVQEAGGYFLRPQHCLQTAIDRRGGITGANVQLWVYSVSNGNQKWDIAPANPSLSKVGYDRKSQNIAIFPNPVQTIFSIAGLTKKTLVYLVDLSGKVVLRREVHPADGIIDISNLSKGVYFLQAPSKIFQAQRIIKM